jgi:RNA polymerase sigma-70 factor, ECF subfamily
VLGCLSDKQVPRFTHPTRGAIRGTVKQLSDDELARRLVSGDHDAMAVIFDRYYRLIMSVALRILHDAAEAEDVVQTVFTDFYTKAHLFDGAKGSLRTWLLQYAYGRSFNQKRKLRARGFYGQVEFDEMATGTPHLCSERVLDLDTPDACRLVEQILPSLNDKQRIVIELVFFGGFKLSEVAAQTGESLGNVHHAYYRGIERLRSALLGAGGEASDNPIRSRVRLSWFRRIRQAPQHLGEEV